MKLQFYKKKQIIDNITSTDVIVNLYGENIRKLQKQHIIILNNVIKNYVLKNLQLST